MQSIQRPSRCARRRSQPPPFNISSRDSRASDMCHGYCSAWPCIRGHSLPTPSRGHGTRRRGFTIFELVVVLLIMGIFTAVTAPTFFDSMLFHRVESAARRVKADLELARTQARLTSATQSLTFSNSTYTISNTKSLDKPGSLYYVDLTKQPYLLDSAVPNFSSAATVSFDGYGTPSSGGTVVLKAKTHTCTVTVDATTGSVTITSSHSGGRTAQVTGS